MSDPFALQRFVAAQEQSYPRALAELTGGRKQSHWMWFVFPQLKALGRSPTAQFYGIASSDEARAYLAHPVLGERLQEATQAVLAHPGSSLHTIFGSPDDLKFRSSMTLFASVAADPSLFAKALGTFCGGQMDERTLQILATKG